MRLRTKPYIVKQRVQQVMQSRSASDTIKHLVAPSSQFSSSTCNFLEELHPQGNSPMPVAFTGHSYITPQNTPQSTPQCPPAPKQGVLRDSYTFYPQQSSKHLPMQPGKCGVKGRKLEFDLSLGAVAGKIVDGLGAPIKLGSWLGEEEEYCITNPGAHTPHPKE